jgi:hypothetical protein
VAALTPRMQPQRQLLAEGRSAKHPGKDMMQRREPPPRHNSRTAATNLHDLTQQLFWSCRLILLRHGIAPRNDQGSSAGGEFPHHSVDKETSTSGPEDDVPRFHLLKT